MKHWFSDILAFRRDPMKLLLERGKASEFPLQRLHLGRSPVYLVTDPALIKPILKSDESTIDKGRLVRTMESALGPSSLTISGRDHRARRAVLHRLMARGVVEQYSEQMAAVIREMAVHASLEESFRADEICRPLALRLISVILFGHDVLSEGDRSALIDAVLKAENDVCNSLFRMAPLLPWQQRRQKRLRCETKATMALIVKRVKDRITADTAVAALQKLDLDDEALGNEILTMLIAGHHTTGGAAAWLLYYLAIKPDLADQIADEASCLSNACGEIDAGRLREAKTTYGFVREVLRLYPSSWWFSRETKKPTEIAGIDLEPGTSILFCQWHLHRDPRYWAAPDQFDITRDFSTPAYIPFGAGPRACVGMGAAMLELQLLALEVAHSFKVSRTTDNPVPLPSPSITLIPPSLELRLVPRGKRSAVRTTGLAA